MHLIILVVVYIIVYVIRLIQFVCLFLIDEGAYSHLYILGRSLRSDVFDAHSKLLVLFSCITLFVLSFLGRFVIVVLGSVGIIVIVFVFVVIVVVVAVVVVIVPAIGSGMAESFVGFAKGFAKVSAIVGSMTFLFAILAEGSRVSGIGNSFSEWLLIGRCDVGALALGKKNCSFVASVLLVVVFILYFAYELDNVNFLRIIPIHKFTLGKGVEELVPCGWQGLC